MTVLGASTELSSSLSSATEWCFSQEPAPPQLRAALAAVMPFSFSAVSQSQVQKLLINFIRQIKGHFSVSVVAAARQLHTSDTGTGTAPLASTSF